MTICSICGGKDNRLFSAKEMMFGYPEEFQYSECLSCNSLRIVEEPKDLQKYYPENYYSFRENKSGLVKKILKKQRGRYVLGKSHLFGKMLTKIWNEPLVASWIKHLNLNFNAKILDIGCGKALHLRELLNFGYYNLLGIDPFINHSIHIKDKLSILKQDISDTKGEFDFIMMNHALEHSKDQKETLSHIFNLLHPSGVALIRIPITNTFAWKEFGTNWVQLDAPRHLFLHSEKSFKIMASEIGFEVSKVVFDSTFFQFTGSLGYVKGIPLVKQNEQMNFSENEMREFINKAEMLNNTHQGDQACFYLKKK